MRNELNKPLMAPENKPCDREPELTKGMNMRRKLMFALFGGLLMQTIVPLGAASAEDKPSSGDEITEEMILEFLQNLFKVIKHDDLTDIGFIEKTLGVKAVWVRDRGVVAGRKVTDYTLTEPKSKVFLDTSNLSSYYTVSQPLSGGKMVIDIRIRISINEPRQPDVTVNNMESIFGKPQFSQFVIIDSGAYLPLAYAYRWQNKNDLVAQFMFRSDTGALESVDVFQNDGNRLKYYPLK